MMGVFIVLASVFPVLVGGNLFCVEMCVFGDSFSNVSSDGIGSVSRRSRDVCIVLQRVLVLVGCGACFKRANAGASASCRTFAA